MAVSLLLHGPHTQPTPRAAWAHTSAAAPALLSPRQTIKFWNFMGAVGVTYFCFYNYDKYLEWCSKKKREWVRADTPCALRAQRRSARARRGTAAIQHCVQSQP